MLLESCSKTDIYHVCTQLLSTQDVYHPWFSRLGASVSLPFAHKYYIIIMSVSEHALALRWFPQDRMWSLNSLCTCSKVLCSTPVA